MSSTSPCTGSVSPAIVCKLPLCSHNSEKTNTEHKWFASCNMKEPMNIMSEELGICSDDEKQSVIVPIVELSGGLSVQGYHGHISGPKATSELVVALISDEINICQEFTQSLSLDAKAQKCLSKCKTFPVSRKMQVFSSSTNRRPDSPGATAQGQDSSANGTSGWSRSISLHSSSTLVSAMKGGRALKGTMVKSDLRVKWAPDVYDPPSTYMLHTEKGHRQRPKAKKKDKHKHKGKSSRGSSAERKHANRKSFNKT